MPTVIERQIFELRCARGNARLMNAFKSSYIRANDLRDIALGRRARPFRNQYRDNLP